MTRVYVHPGARGAALAAERRLVAVVVDALRATGTVTTLLAHGAQRVLVVGEPEEAFALRDALRAAGGSASVMCVGERGGLMIPGCDRGNEPLTGDETVPPTVVFTSSNCARVCLGVCDAPAALLGHTINASATARAASAIAASLATDILLIPAGFADDEARLNLEDTLTCGCIIARGGLEPANDAALAAFYAYQHVGPKALAEHFLQGSHGRHLAGLGRETDIRFLAQVDITDVVGIRERVGELAGVRYVEFVGSRRVFA